MCIRQLLDFKAIICLQFQKIQHLSQKGAPCTHTHITLYAIALHLRSLPQV